MADQHDARAGMAERIRHGADTARLREVGSAYRDALPSLPFALAFRLPSLS
jgi:hypothetical protein